MFSPLARLPELSLGALPPREHALEFGTIKASSWCCSGLLPGVSPVFDRTETILQEMFSPLARLPELSLGALPPESTLSSSVPSRHLLGAVAVYYRGSPQYSIVQKLFWGKFSPHSPGSQSCLWERFPPESEPSGSVPSRYLLGAVAVYYRGSPQYSIVQKLFWRKCFPHSPGSQSCLWERFPPESTLSIPPEVSCVFFSKAIVGTVSSSCATPHASSRAHAITALSLWPIVDCRVFFNSFDAHAGWLRDRRRARSLNLLFRLLPIFNVDKQLGTWDLRVVVVVVSHIQRIGCQPEKNYFTRWPIPLVVC